MYHVLAVNQRDAQPAFLERDALRVGLLRRRAASKKRAPTAVANLVFSQIRQVAEESLRHLAELLLDGHPGNQYIDLFLDFRRRCRTHNLWGDRQHNR